MINVLFVTDEYVRQNFPIPERMSSVQLEGFIKAAQLTHLTSQIGYCLYERLEDGVDAEDLTTDEIEVYKVCQYLTGMYTYQVASEFLKSELSNTKHEEANSSRWSIDEKISAMQSQIDSIESRLRRLIDASTDISDLAKADNCNYGLDIDYDSVISYPYPYDYLQDEDC